MQISPINNQNRPTFGMNYKLSEKTIKAIEKSTGLTYDEMTRLPLDESVKLMKERGTIKEPNKLWTWMQEKYKKGIKQIPIKINGKKSEIGEAENLDEIDNTEKDENANLPEGAVGMKVQQKTITDSNGEPVVEIIKTITYEDGSVQKIIDKVPLEAL